MLSIKKNTAFFLSFKNNSYIFCLITIICFAISCEKSPVTPTPEPPPVEEEEDSCLHISPESKIIEKIVFLGHTYHGAHTVDERLEYLATKDYFDQFEHIWLGGDMCSETTQRSTTIDYLDCLFDLSHPRSHWALGNHDVRNGDVHFITDATERPTYYTSTHDNLVLMVLNTNLADPDCEEMNNQITMIKNVCDTIQEASHLVVLTHHVIWGDSDAGIQQINMWDRANGNKAHWLSECKPNTKFHQTLYQYFTAVQSKGIQVVFIAGDYGQREKEFQYLSAKGIWMIASGIARTYTEHNGLTLPSDNILELRLDKANRDLTWEFVNLDSLELVW